MGQEARPRNSPAATSQAAPLIEPIALLAQRGQSAASGREGVQGVGPRGVKCRRGEQGVGELSRKVGSPAELNNETRISLGTSRLESRNIVVISRNPAEGLLELPTPKGPPVALKPLTRQDTRS